MTPAHPDAEQALAELADAIGRSHRRGESLAERTRRAHRRRLELARRTGALLRRAKPMVGHGRWETWVSSACGFSARTARVYLQVARNWGQIQEVIADRQHAADLSLRAILKVIAKSRVEKILKVSLASPPNDELGYGEALRHEGPTIRAASDHASSDQASSPESNQAQTDYPTQGTRKGSGPVGREVRGASSRQKLGASGGGAPDSAGADASGTGRSIDALESKTRSDSIREPAYPAGPPGDADWLASLPIRKRIRDRHEFDRQALAWRRVQPAVQHLMRLYRPSEEDRRRLGAAAGDLLLYTARVAALMSSPPPESWQLCVACGGGTTDIASLEPCATCDGLGFLIACEGNLAEAGTGRPLGC